MGEIKVSIKLENYDDLVALKRGWVKKEDLRCLEIDALVDTGSVMLVIPQDVVEVLGLEYRRKVIVTYADERKDERHVAGPLQLTISNRLMLTECVVGPPASEALVGQVVLEEMDLIPDCVNQTLKPRPESPHYPMLKLK